MAIISASRRTDIPAFYGAWLAARLKAGYAMVRHPFRADWVRRVDLSPAAVDGLVFWTRWPKPFLKHLELIENLGLPCYFQMTLTAMPPALEPNLPPEEELIGALAEISERVGPGRLVWRFDPLLVTNLTPPDEILTRFERLAGRLGGRCRGVVVSLAQLYAKATRRLGKIPNIEVVDLQIEKSLADDLLGRLAETAARYGLAVKLCAGEGDYSELGIGPGKCVDESIFNEEYGLRLDFEPDRGQRPACGCTTSIDIGAYNSCLFGCRYCYANVSLKAARNNHARHDPASEFLIS